MDKILKWNMTDTYIDTPDERAELDKLLKSGWEPFAATDYAGHIRVLLKRPCGELSVTKHPEITQEKRADVVEERNLDKLYRDSGWER